MLVERTDGRVCPDLYPRPLLYKYCAECPRILFACILDRWAGRPTVIDEPMKSPSAAMSLWLDFTRAARRAQRFRTYEAVGLEKWTDRRQREPRVGVGQVFSGPKQGLAAER